MFYSPLFKRPGRLGLNVEFWNLPELCTERWAHREGCPALTPPRPTPLSCTSKSAILPTPHSRLPKSIHFTPQLQPWHVLQIESSRPFFFFLKAIAYGIPVCGLGPWEGRRHRQEQVGQTSAVLCLTWCSLGQAAQHLLHERSATIYTALLPMRMKCLWRLTAPPQHGVCKLLIHQPILQRKLLTCEALL